MDYKTIILNKKRDGVATVTLHGPEKRNAANRTMLEEIASAFAEIDRDNDIRVAVVTGQAEQESLRRLRFVHRDHSSAVRDRGCYQCPEGVPGKEEAAVQGEVILWDEAKRIPIRDRPVSLMAGSGAAVVVKVCRKCVCDGGVGGGDHGNLGEGRRHRHGDPE